MQSCIFSNAQLSSLGGIPAYASSHFRAPCALWWNGAQWIHSAGRGGQSCCRGFYRRGNLCLLVFQLACAPCECSFPISAVVGVASLAIDQGAELGGYGIDHINILLHMQIELMMALCRDYTKSCRELQTRSGDMQSCAANNSSIGKFGHGSHRDWYTALREQHAPYAVQSR